jgi:hypothetical protein
VKPGDTFQVHANGVVVNVTVPENTYTGETIRVDIPPQLAPPPSSSSTSFQVQAVTPPPPPLFCDVQVPKGLNPGNLFQVQVNGSIISVAVPDGYVEGQTMRISIPSPPPVVQPTGVVINTQAMNRTGGGGSLSATDRQRLSTSRTPVLVTCPHCDQRTKTKIVHVNGPFYNLAFCGVKIDREDRYIWHFC